MVRACVHRLAIVLAGCYSPSYRDCEITCAGQSSPSACNAPTECAGSTGNGSPGNSTALVHGGGAAGRIRVRTMSASWQASGAVVSPPAV
jgi:hypothetical protein